MRSARKVIVLASCLAGQVALASLAAAAPPGSIPYRLDLASTFEVGCLAPCMCPVLMRQPATGTLTLESAGGDGSFRVFAVRDVDWLVDDFGTPLRVTGLGTYRVGGESGVEQQLVLDLAIDDGPVRRYDSGLVSGGQSFPALDVSVAIHGFFCYDSVFHVRAKPVVMSVTPHDPGAIQLEATPNPFRRTAQIEFVLPVPGRADVRIYDLSGRVVRVLSGDLWFEAGFHALVWDGRATDGTRLASGIYFVSLRSASGQTRGMLIKL